MCIHQVNCSGSEISIYIRTPKSPAIYKRITLITNKLHNTKVFLGLFKDVDSASSINKLT